MIWVTKGNAPAVLLKDGAGFESGLVEMAGNHSTIQTYIDNLPPLPKKKGKPKKADDPKQKAKTNFNLSDDQMTFFNNAKTDDSGIFNGYASKLFSTYSYYSHPTVKRELIKSHYGKCVFCESFIMSTDVGDVEHYRPKAEVRQADPKNTQRVEKVDDHPGYYWLSQTWGNLFLSCRQCNEAFKGNRFDVIPREHNFQMTFVRLTPGSNQEGAMLLYPGSNGADPLNPRDVLKFDPNTGVAYAQPGGAGDAQNNGARAFRTIEIVGLNRGRLLQARAAHLVKLRSLFVLAAIGGGWQQEQGPPDILKFEYPKDGPWVHARNGLIQGVQPFAEFSALSQDALIEWNKELKVVPNLAFVAQLKQQVTVYVNQNIVLPLEPWLQLYQGRVASSEQDLDRESQPDTRDLDERYNDALDRYKKVCGEIRSDLAKLKKNHPVTSNRRLQLANLEQTIRQQMQPVLNNFFQSKSAELEWEDPLFEVEEELRRCRKSKVEIDTELAIYSYAAYQIRGERVPYEQIPEQFRERVRLATQVDPQTMQNSAVNLQQSLSNLQKRFEVYSKLSDQLSQVQSKFSGQENSLLDAIEESESLAAGFADRLADIAEDATDLELAYRNRGCKGNRTDRVVELKDAANELDDYVMEFEMLSDTISEHLKPPKGKGFPSQITLK